MSRPGRRAERVLATLADLGDVYDGTDVDELTHALQVATRAERSGADDEVVLAALCHDIGKVLGDAGHGEMAAGLLTPHVRSDVVEAVRHHSSFSARHWGKVAVGAVDPRDGFVSAPWFDLAVTFVDDWDMQSFDPAYEPEPLRHFAPLVQRLVTGP